MVAIVKCFWWTFTETSLPHKKLSALWFTSHNFLMNFCIIPSLMWRLDSTILSAFTDGTRIWLRTGLAVSLVRSNHLVASGSLIDVSSIWATLLVPVRFIRNGSFLLLYRRSSANRMHLDDFDEQQWELWCSEIFKRQKYNFMVRFVCFVLADKDKNWWFVLETFIENLTLTISFAACLWLFFVAFGGQFDTS